MRSHTVASLGKFKVRQEPSFLNALAFFIERKLDKGARMEKEIIFRKKQPSSGRMAAALDLLIDFLLEEYGKESTLLPTNSKRKRKVQPMFGSKSNHKLH